MILAIVLFVLVGSVFVGIWWARKQIRQNQTDAEWDRLMSYVPTKTPTPKARKPQDWRNDPKEQDLRQEQFRRESKKQAYKLHQSSDSGVPLYVPPQEIDFPDLEPTLVLQAPSQDVWEGSGGSFGGGGASGSWEDSGSSISDSSGSSFDSGGGGFDGGSSSGSSD